MEVAAEGVGVLGAEIRLDAADGEIHDGEAARGGVALFRLLPPQPHPAGSLRETKWALPPRPFDFVCLRYASAVLALRLHTARRDSAILNREAHSAEPAKRRQTAAGAAGGVVDAAVVLRCAHDLR